MIETPKKTKLYFNDETYTLLKRIAQILLPAIGTLYFGIASIWGLPYAEQIVGTVMTLDAFLGVLLGLSTAQYMAGTEN